MIDPKDLDRRCVYHPATTPERREAHERIRAGARAFMDVLNETVPDDSPRELATAITWVEHAMFWGNAGVARPD